MSQPPCTSTFVSQYEKRLQFGRGAIPQVIFNNKELQPIAVCASKLQPFLILTDKSPNTQRAHGMAWINDHVCGFHPVPYATLYETAIDV